MSEMSHLTSPNHNEQPGALEPRIEEELTPKTLLTGMLHWSLDQVLEILPNETYVDKFKRSAAKDLIGYAKGQATKMMDSTSDEEVLKSLKMAAKFLGEFSRRIEEWDGENMQELSGVLEDGQRAVSEAEVSFQANDRDE